MKYSNSKKSENATPDSQVPSKKKRPVLFWLVLAQIFLFFIATGLTIANPFLQRQKVIDRIRSLGGVIYEEQSGPAWLKQIARNIPLHNSSNVVAVDLSSAEVDDETLELLSAFPDLRSLSIHGPNITAKGLENLNEMKKLKSLMLINCPQIAIDEENTLHELHPQLLISRRGSALLGISGRQHRWGCEVVTVRPHSAASQVGLKSGDVIVSLGGNRINGINSLTDTISQFQPGDNLSIRYFRGHRRFSEKVTLGSWTDESY